MTRKDPHKESPSKRVCKWNKYYLTDLWQGECLSQDNGETVVFIGLSRGQQLVSGTATFENLVLDTKGNISNNATVKLEGTLRLANNTTFDADGSGTGVFTIVSNASGTARVAALTGSAKVTGNVRYQRHFDGAGNVRRNFGVAVDGFGLKIYTKRMKKPLLIFFQMIVTR